MNVDDSISLRDGRPADADAIADAIVMAITPDTVSEQMCHDRASLEQMRLAFREMALRDDTQYSYRNAVIAETSDGEIAGVSVGYDGARLSELRAPFIEYVSEKYGYNLSEGLQDETSADEFYIDTLAVLPEFRHRGIATRLLKAMIQRAHLCGKPAGLLVDKANERARRLYLSLGFEYVEDRPFFGEMMDRLLRAHPTKNVKARSCGFLR